MCDEGGVEDTDFGLQESFQIDDGQLDPFEKHECYVFGWETGTLAAHAENEMQEWSSLVHVANWSRVEDALLKRGRTFTTEVHCDTWMTVYVEAYDAGQYD